MNNAQYHINNINFKSFVCSVCSDNEFFNTEYRIRNLIEEKNIDLVVDRTTHHLVIFYKKLLNAAHYKNLITVHRFKKLQKFLIVCI